MSTAQTYLQLVNSAILLSGCDLEQLSSADFASPTKALQVKFKRWANQAHRDIQMQRRAWEYKAKEALITLSPAIYVQERSGLNLNSVLHAAITCDETGATFTCLGTGDAVTGTLAAGTFLGNMYYEELSGQFKFGEYVDVGTVGSLANFVITAAGTLYDAGATAGIIGGGGSGASVAVATGTDAQSRFYQTVTGATVTTGGTGFTSNPTAAVNAISGGSGATASAQIGVADAFRILGWGRYVLTNYVSDLFEPDKNTFYVSRTGASTEQDNDASFSEQKLIYVPYEQWVGSFGAGPQETPAYGMPSHFTENPSGGYEFYPRLDKQYIIKFWYEKAISELSLYTDTVSDIPADYQDIIAWKAIMYYGDYENQPSVWQMARKRFAFYEKKMEEYLMPTVDWSPSPYRG